MLLLLCSSALKSETQEFFSWAFFSGIAICRLRKRRAVKSIMLFLSFGHFHIKSEASEWVPGQWRESFTVAHIFFIPELIKKTFFSLKPHLMLGFFHSLLLLSSRLSLKMRFCMRKPSIPVSTYYGTREYCISHWDERKFSIHHRHCRLYISDVVISIESDKVEGFLECMKKWALSNFFGNKNLSKFSIFPKKCTILFD